MAKRLMTITITTVSHYHILLRAIFFSKRRLKWWITLFNSILKEVGICIYISDINTLWYILFCESTNIQSGGTSIQRFDFDWFWSGDFKTSQKISTAPYLEVNSLLFHLITSFKLFYHNCLITEMFLLTFDACFVLVFWVNSTL